MRYTGLIPYFDQILAKRELSNSAVIQFCDIQFRVFLVLKLFAVQDFAKMVKNCENREV